MMSTTLLTFTYDEFEHSACDYLTRRGNYLSKQPLDILESRSLVDENILRKQLCVIIMLRDVRDVITSKHPTMPDRYFIGYEGGWSATGKYPDFYPMFTHPGIGKIYDAMNQSLTAFRPSVATVRYEDLTTRPDEIQAELAEHFSLKFNGKFSKFHEHPERHAYKYQGNVQALDQSLVRESSAVDPGRRGKWRSAQHSERILSQFQKYPQLFDILISQGYETDRRWFSNMSSPRSKQIVDCQN